VPESYDDEILEKAKAKQQSSRKDPFKKLGVGAEDKMTFFLLKWIFNAIKRES
jgi:hypothetical protein